MSIDQNAISAATEAWEKSANLFTRRAHVQFIIEAYEAAKALVRERNTPANTPVTDQPVESSWLNGHGDVVKHSDLHDECASCQSKEEDLQILRARLSEREEQQLHAWRIAGDKWREVKPTYEAQRARSELAFSIDPEEVLPPGVWGIADMAAQIALSSIEQEVQQPDEIWGDSEKLKWMCTGETTEAQSAFVANVLYGNIKIPNELNNRIVGAWLESYPEREAVYRAGDSVPSKDPRYDELVAVPVAQMKDIYQRLRNLNDLGKTHIDNFLTQSKELTELKGKILDQSEIGALLAGNWGQRRRVLAERESSELSVAEKKALVEMLAVTTSHCSISTHRMKTALDLILEKYELRRRG